MVIVSAIGTVLEPALQALDEAFKAVDYVTRSVRVSELLEQLYGTYASPRPPATSKSEWLMDLGDRLRGEAKSGDAAMCLALLEIRNARAREGANSDTGERAGVVTIVRSAKRDDEINLLRSVYGSRLLVLGFSAAERERQGNLVDRLRQEVRGRGPDEYLAEAERLMSRDQADSLTPHGQSVRKAFALADAFIWVRTGRNVEGAIQRVIKVWFGHPFVTPTRDEQAMYFAHAAKFRSAAAGRQVGAAVVDSAGEVLVTGANDVPKPGGGQFWTGDDPDYRDFILNFEMNDRIKLDVTADVLRRLKAGNWLNSEKSKASVEELVFEASGPRGALEGSRINDLIEFGRILHAEMAAICTAARRGTSLLGSSLFTTTYPCHECARLIIGAGIRRVVYIDPYTKSQVATLFGHLVTDDPYDTSGTKVQFVPFEGVAPGLFADVFRMNQRERGLDGVFKAWKPQPLTVRLVNGPPPLGDETGLLAQFEATELGKMWGRREG